MHDSEFKAGNGVLAWPAALTVALWAGTVPPVAAVPAAVAPGPAVPAAIAPEPALPVVPVASALPEPLSAPLVMRRAAPAPPESGAALVAEGETAARAQAVSDPRASATPAPVTPAPVTPGVASDSQLEGLRGGAATPWSDMKLNGTVGNNSAVNVVSGTNTIADGAFSNASGLPMVIQNSGSNVLIQNATIVNVQFK